MVEYDLVHKARNFVDTGEWVVVGFAVMVFVVVVVVVVEQTLRLVQQVRDREVDLAEGQLYEKSSKETFSP